jgi:HAD superfamily hydrolase (TIGR01509 family)
MTTGETFPSLPFPTLRAVIFDLDGTLVDSEQYGHRVAFNQAFEAFGLPDRWEPDRYRELLAVTGGERRLFGWFASPESSECGRSEAERRELAKAVHRWKTDRFETLAASGAIPRQPGAGAMLDGLAEAGLALAVATTGSRQWVEPLLEKQFDRARFSVVVTGDDVARRKPDPEAYLVALERLGVGPDEAVAVEDSGPGWEAARDAGLACLVVANEETSRPAVAGAPLVIEGFGTEGGPAPVVIADRFSVVKSPWRAAEILVALLAASQADGRERSADAP